VSGPDPEFTAPEVAIMRHERTRRTGFTIVELLVAAALSMVIMLILGMAFQKMTDTFRTLRSVSQMQERLKSSHMVLKRDLEAYHFYSAGQFASGGGPSKLSQQRLDQNGWVPTTDGFFCIMQGSSPLMQYPYEGLDSDGLPSSRAVTHSLHFTALLSPDPLITTIPHEEDFFYANAPNNPAGNLAGKSPVDFQRPSGTIFSSRWAEVMYFLVPNGATANGEPLFALYRRQRLLIDGISSTPSQSPNTAVPWNGGLEAQYPNISWGPNAQSPVGAPPGPGPRVNRTSDIPVKANRLQPFASPQPNGYGNIWRGTRLDPSEIAGLSPGLQGDDILLTDVLGFEVKVNWSTGTASMTFEKFSQPGTNTDWPFDYLPAQNGNPRNPLYNDATLPARTFDTWSIADASSAVPPINWNDSVQGSPTSYNTSGTTRPPLRIRINSLQIRIRVWDQAGQTARQMTIVEDM
jgi:type II secretory pathway pseudopilin PulG